ncbi:hypothetical protein ALC53_06762 [Atta colombica]|uniref:Uncharacterized protein n=1 Tax=Atta colombica TaxID=520822 RepID=A0A151I360_9HYME|nr:hypothetical protein ALC53_06762 [Atta colombica]
MFNITRFELPILSLTVPEYTQHQHLSVTLSDTFSTSVLLQLPLSAVALSRQFGHTIKHVATDSALYNDLLLNRDQTRATLRSFCMSTSDDANFKIHHSQLEGAKDSRLPIRTMNRGKQRFNFPRASTKKNQHTCTRQRCT